MRALGGEDYVQVHGRSDYEFPQLEMERPHLDALPSLSLPPGYTLRHYQPGDEKAWGEIMTRAFSPHWDEKRFRRVFLPHFGFRPERVLFVCYEGEVVGSACAFAWPGIPPERGYIHMVGVKDDHCGQSLGFWLTAAALWRLREDGFRSAMLQTESFRIPAIKHYLRLGFRPLLVSESQREIWRGILGRIAPALVEEFRLEEMPVMNGLSFWWRTMMVTHYNTWLNFKGRVVGI